jgi:drug/metabolite transporter (DMT)-like permease
VVAALLAWLILSERPGTATVVGGAVVLVGISLLLRGRRSAVPA